MEVFHIPINTPDNISCSLEGMVISGAILKYRNNTIIEKDMHTQPVELIPGIVTSRNSPLISIVLTVNTSNTDVVGLGCEGGNGRTIHNVTIFGELQFVNNRTS